jgi:hypothetical protein
MSFRREARYHIAARPSLYQHRQLPSTDNIHPSDGLTLDDGTIQRQDALGSEPPVGITHVIGHGGYILPGSSSDLPSPNTSLADDDGSIVSSIV